MGRVNSKVYRVTGEGIKNMQQEPRNHWQKDLDHFTARKIMGWKIKEKALIPSREKMLYWYEGKAMRMLEKDWSPTRIWRHLAMVLERCDALDIHPILQHQIDEVIDLLVSRTRICSAIERAWEQKT